MAHAASRTSGPRIFGSRALALVVWGMMALLITGCGSADTSSGGTDDTSSNPGLEGVFVTRAGYAACQEEDRFHEMMAHIAEQESEAYRAMLADTLSGCFPLKEGVEVEILTWNVVHAEIQPVGTATSVWTVAEALRAKDTPQDSTSEGPAS